VVIKDTAKVNLKRAVGLLNNEYCLVWCYQTKGYLGY